MTQYTIIRTLRTLYLHAHGSNLKIITVRCVLSVDIRAVKRNFNEPGRRARWWG